MFLIASLPNLHYKWLDSKLSTKGFKSSYLVQSKYIAHTNLEVLQVPLVLLIQPGLFHLNEKSKTNIRKHIFPYVKFTSIQIL